MGSAGFMTGWLGDHAGLHWAPGIDQGSTHHVIVGGPERTLAADTTGRALLVERHDQRIEGLEQHLIGTVDQRTYWVVDSSDTFEETWIWSPPRPLIIGATSAEFIPLSAALQWLDFLREHRFCGACGQSMRPSSSDRGRQCASCSLISYPRVSPSIIILITRGDEMLLARSPRFTNGMYSTLAGFVEAGESAEHACHREIFEEVRVHIYPPKFLGSQSWPFKHSLMLGYRAEWRSSEIQVDGVEIIDAQWFHPDRLPPLPQHASISRGLIDHFLSERGYPLTSHTA